MKTRVACAVILFSIMVSLALHGQGKAPTWINSSSREMEYPAGSYYTGFAMAAIGSGESVEVAAERAIQIAKSELAEKIRVKIASQKMLESQSISGTGVDEQLREKFTSATYTEAQAEIANVKVQTYHDRDKREVYAFTCANRRELASYYKSNLSVNLAQIESFVKTAQDLEASGEKAKARQQLETAKPLFAKVRYAQDLLTAVDPNASTDDLQQAKTENLYNLLTQMQARLAQGVYIFVESSEDLFGAKVNIAVNQLKAELSRNGCSFTITGGYHIEIKVIMLRENKIGGTYKYYYTPCDASKGGCEIRTVAPLAYANDDDNKELSNFITKVVIPSMQKEMKGVK